MEDVSWSLVLGDLAEGRRVGLAREKVDHSAHQLVPLLLVVLPQVFTHFVDMLVQALDASVDVALFGVCDGAEFVFLLDHFGEVPQFGGTAHVLSFEGVVDGLHVLQRLGCTLKLFVLSLLPRKHTLADDRVLYVLMHCWVDVFQLFHSRLDNLISEGLITIVFPDPIAAQFLQLQLIGSLLPFFLFHLHLGLGVHSKRLLGGSGISSEGGI